MAITIEEAAKMLGRSGTRVRKFVTEGRIKAEKIGRDWMVDEVSLTAYKLSMAGAVSRLLRQQILNRDGRRCRGCGWVPENSYRERDLQVHHVIERDNGGTNDPENLLTLCVKCHGEKHPTTKGLTGRNVWLPVELIGAFGKVTDGSDGQIVDYLIAICEKGGIELGELPKTVAQRKARIANLEADKERLFGENRILSGKLAHWRDDAMCHDVKCGYEEMLREVEGELQDAAVVTAPSERTIGGAEQLRRAVPGREDLQTMINQKQGHESSAATVVARYRCEHCGRTPAVPRVGDVCGSCRMGGHNGEPRDCRTCAENSGTGAL